MFSDRHLALKLTGTLLLLWVSFLYSRRRAEDLYPAFSACTREPERHAGRVLAFRAAPVTASEPGLTVLKDREGGPVPLRGTGDRTWAGRHLTGLGRFVPPSEGRPAALEVLRDATGAPRVRLEAEFPARRVGMYAVSFVAALGWAILFRRHFALDLPRGLFGKRGDP